MAATRRTARRSSQHEPAAGRAAQALAAAEQDEVGALLAEPPQVLARRQLGRGIDDDRHAVLSRRLDDDGERQHVAGEVRLRDVDDGGGPCRQQRAQLALRLPARSSGWRLAGDGPELHELSAGELDHGVIRDAMRAVDDELPRVRRELRLAQDAIACPAGHARGRRQEQARRRAARDECRLVPRQLGQPPADRVLELGQVDEAGGRLAHRVEHFGRHERSTEDRERRSAIDDRFDAEATVDRTGRGRRIHARNPTRWRAASRTSSPSDARFGVSQILPTDFDVGFHDGLAVGSLDDGSR